MAEPFSLASGIVGLITLSTAVLTAGYKYVNSVASAPEDFKSLIRETASLSAVLSQVISHSLSEQAVQQASFHTLIQEGVLQDCEDTLRNVQSLIRRCAPVGGHRGKNAGNALLWPVRQKEIIKNREQLGRLCASLHIAISIDNASTLVRLECKQDQAHEAIMDVSQTMIHAQEQKILDWLSSQDPAPKHRAITRLQQPDTNRWLLEERSIQEWLSQGTFLWLHGPAGIGKTVLASSLIEHLDSIMQNTSTQGAIAFHYCDFANEETLDPIRILGSLVRQLAIQMNKVPNSVQNLYHEYSGHSLELEALITLLKEVVNQDLRRTYLIIDGLDECPNKVECSKRNHLIRALNSLYKTSNATATLKILVTSRPEYDIQQELRDEPSFCIQSQHVQADVETHIWAEIAKMPRVWNMPLEVREKLVSDLADRADGTFRWAQCQLEVLQKVKTRRALRDALDTLPTGLHETYDRILEPIDDADFEYVFRALNWLVGAKRPLLLKELVEAIAIDPFKSRLDIDERLIVPEEIFDLCSSLIRTMDDQTVVLAHLSVKEYLLSSHITKKAHSISRFALQEARCQSHISMSMLSYIFSIGSRLQMPEQGVFSEEGLPLTTYILQEKAIEKEHLQACRPWTERLVSSDGSEFSQWISFASCSEPLSPHQENRALVMFIQRVVLRSLMDFWEEEIALFGAPDADVRQECSFEKIAVHFLRFQKEWENPKNKEDILRPCNGLDNASPLSTAAAYGFEQVTRFMLANGAMVNGIPQCNSKNFRGNPLIRAARYGHECVVRALVESGAEINILIPIYPFNTFLIAAAWKSPRLVEYSLEELRVDTNEIDGYGRTIHYWARHDTFIRGSLQPFKDRLEALRKRDAEYVDVHILYKTILNFLRDMKLWPSTRGTAHCRWLSRCLFLCGPDYHDYAAAFSEQGVLRTNPILHARVVFTRCDMCSDGTIISGPCFVCMECIDVEFCAACYSNWKASKGKMCKGKMEMCRGHSFYEIPRPCWYGFEQEVVMEDGSTLEDVINLLEEKFTALERASR